MVEVALFSDPLKRFNSHLSARYIGVYPYLAFS